MCIRDREETLQPESLEMEDTSIKQVHTADDQNPGLVVGQNTGDIEVREVPDIIDSQIHDDGTNPK